MVATVLESLYGKDKVKPIMEIYEGVAGRDGTYPQSDIDRDFWQFIQHAMFGGGYEEKKETTAEDYY